MNRATVPGSRGAIALGVFALVVIGGIRFSDGSMLLAIASGATVADPVFARAAPQYVWDSPLKVALLNLLPAHFAAIAAAFALLAVLPLAGLVARDARLRALSLAAIFLTPAFKISIQNIGVGDGLVVLLILIASASSRVMVIAAALFAIGLWHPQQSFFIGGSFLLARHCFGPRLERRDVMAVAGSLAAAALVYFSYRYLLAFSFAGREAYLADQAGGFLAGNFAAAPIAFAPLLIWLGLIAPRPERGLRWLVAWIVVLAAVSVLTTDVTRVMTLTSLPIVLAGAARLLDGGRPLPLRRLAVAAILILLLPPYSYSGFDWWLWGDLRADACRWAGYCP